MRADVHTRMTQRADKMATEPLLPLISKMAAPAIVAFLINAIYSLADTYFVSGLGTNATAAVSVNASLDQIIMMAGSLVAVGSASYISRLLGADRHAYAQQVISTAFFTAVAFGTLLGIVGMIWMRPLVYLLGATPTCEQYAMEYASYVLLAAPFMAANFVMNQCLRAEGSSLYSMFGMGFGGILNCFLDPIFITGLGMGVRGASLATAISKFISFLILLMPYVSGKTLLRISVRNIVIEKEMASQVLSVGSSSLFRNLFAVVSAVFLNKIAGNISDSVLAGIGVCTKVMMFPFGVILGFGTGFQPVTGFNYGAKRYDRVRQSFRIASLLAIGGSAFMALLLGIFSKQAIGVFVQADPQMLQIGMLCIVLQCIALPIHAWVAVVNMFCAGLGDARGAFLLSTARQGSCLLPIIYPLAWLFSANGVAAAQALADFLSLGLGIPILYKVMKRLSAEEVAYKQQSEKIEACDSI